jgi:tetratricopeptide (TPR) repeat protein
MKARQRTAVKLAAEAPQRRPGAWRWWLAALAALYLAFQVYRPVLHGPFLFDDHYLPFRAPSTTPDLSAWLRGVRPLLMFSYWINFRLSGAETFSYHVLNVLVHAGNAALIFLILRRLLNLAGVEAARRSLLAGFGAAVFLMHPVQTESVAYVASRSDSLSALFFYGAFAVFLYRREAAVSWRVALAVLVLFGAAVSTKEHTLALPALLLLTDYYWNPGFSFAGIRRNWRLYAGLAAAAAAGLAFIWKLLFQATTAGFGLRDLAWYQYFFTQCRALFVYFRLFLFPAGQTADYDFPISRGILDHGAIFGLLALLAAVVAALYGRRRFPLASYGLLVFLVVIAPTSSFMPIRDPVAERRMYLPMLGLLLMLLEALRRVRIQPSKLLAGMAMVVLVCGALTYRRNMVWSSATALWEDVVEKAPRNARARFQLAFAYAHDGRPDQAIEQYRAAAELQAPTYELLIDWALAYDQLNRSEEALAKLRQAAGLERTAHVYSQIGMVLAKQARWSEALEALATAEKTDPAFAMTYVYRGGVRAAHNDFAAAAREYRRALALDPQNQPARDGLAAAEGRLRGAP